MRKPLLLRYMMIIDLKSRHNGKRQVLFLMIDNLAPNDWRTLRYHFKKIDLAKQGIKNDFMHSINADVVLIKTQYQ